MISGDSGHNERSKAMIREDAQKEEFCYLEWIGIKTFERNENKTIDFMDFDFFNFFLNIKWWKYPLNTLKSENIQLGTKWEFSTKSLVVSTLVDRSYFWSYALDDT